MGTVMEVVQWALANYVAVIHGVLAVLAALIALFMIIPGEQPERALQGAVDFIARFSRK